MQQIWRYRNRSNTPPTRIPGSGRLGLLGLSPTANRASQRACIHGRSRLIWRRRWSRRRPCPQARTFPSPSHRQWLLIGSGRYSLRTFLCMYYERSMMYVHTVLRTIDAKQLSLSPSSESEACVNFLAPEVPRNRRAKPTAPYLLEKCSGMSLVVMFDRFQIVHMMRR